VHFVVDENRINWVNCPRRERPIHANVKSRKFTQLIQLFRVNYFIIRRRHVKRPVGQRFKPNIAEKPAHLAAIWFVDSLIDLPVRNTSALIWNFHSRTYMHKHGRFKNGALHFSREALVTRIAHNTGRQYMLHISHRLGNDVLYRTTISGITFAENASDARAYCRFVGRNFLVQMRLTNLSRHPFNAP